MADLSSNTTIITLCVNNYTQIKSKTWQNRFWKLNSMPLMGDKF
jgi:hypothetical protein